MNNQYKQYCFKRIGIIIKFNIGIYSKSIKTDDKQKQNDYVFIRSMNRQIHITVPNNRKSVTEILERQRAIFKD